MDDYDLMPEWSSSTDPDLVFGDATPPPSDDSTESYCCTDGECDNPDECGGNHTYSPRNPFRRNISQSDSPTEENSPEVDELHVEDSLDGEEAGIVDEVAPIEAQVDEVDPVVGESSPICSDGEVVQDSQSP